MLRYPKITRQDAALIREIEGQLHRSISLAETTSDQNEQEALLNQIADFERRVNVAQSRYLLLAAREQALEIKSDWLVSLSGLEWLTTEGQNSIRNALRIRRRDDWIKLLPMIVSIIAILVSVTSAVLTSRFAQEKDFLLNRPWISADALTAAAADGNTGPFNKLLLTLGNHGRTPALRVAAFGRTLSVSKTGANIYLLVKSACDQASSPADNGGFVLPEGSSDVLLEPNQDPLDSSPVIVVGCLGYEDTLDHNRHVTSFAFIQSSVVITGKHFELTGKWTPYSLEYGIAR